MAALLALALVVPPASARQMYRYVDDDGVKVIAYQVPPDMIANGYEVLSESGRVIEVVPPQLDDEQRADMAAQRRRELRAAEERAQLREWDERLLLRYSTVADIEAARERALGDLRVRVNILRGEQRSLTQQIEKYQAQAADQERLGYTVDPKLLQAIADLRERVSSTERAIADRREELEAVAARYDRDIARFASLLDIVEMRRRGNLEEPEG